MPLILILGLHLCSMVTRVFPTEASGDRLNRTEQGTQTIFVQSKLVLSNITSRLTNLESELKSGMSTLESEMESGMSDVKSQISKLESLIANGSQLLGRNNETSNNINIAVGDDKKDIVDRVFVIEEDQNWESGRRSCQELGGDLVTVASRAEQEKLMEYLAKSNRDERRFWIGGVVREVSEEGPGNWKWINGDQMTNPDDESFLWAGSEIGTPKKSRPSPGYGCLELRQRPTYYHTNVKNLPYFGFWPVYCKYPLPLVCAKTN